MNIDFSHFEISRYPRYPIHLGFISIDQGLRCKIWNCYLPYATKVCHSSSEKLDGHCFFAINCVQSPHHHLGECTAVEFQCTQTISTCISI